MNSVLHISTECYPVAKAGGMGDVVGALPIYQKKIGWNADVIIPKYRLPWFKGKKLKNIFSNTIILEGKEFPYAIQKLIGDDLSFDIYFVNIPSLFDRDSIYLAEDGHGFHDEPERNIGFQIAVCDFLLNHPTKYQVLHCHDHQAGLIPFFITQVKKYESLKLIPTLFTIHNGQYRGIFHWDRINLLPDYDRGLNGYLDWNNSIHSQAAAIKCAWKVNTVSPSYMREIAEHDEQLQWLYEHEAEKCFGILNGADYDVWNPSTDPMLPFQLKRSWTTFKQKNKKAFCSAYHLNPKYPLFSFIGRLANQKGADILPKAIRNIIEEHDKISFAILGTGDKWIEQELKELAAAFPDKIASIITYDEEIAHQIYAASDFLIMPSRFEPCGLNQLFAMRYATIPIVRKTGGLIDTVPDISNDGNGIVFQEVNAKDISFATERALQLFNDKNQLTALRDKIGNLDFSWKNAAQLYIKHYLEMIG